MKSAAIRLTSILSTKPPPRSLSSLHRGHRFCTNLRMMASKASIVVPDGFTLHTENSANILLPSSNEAFLNPVQEFNRDLSVACIRVWSEVMNEEKERRWRQAEERRANKSHSGSKNKRRRTDDGASETPLEVKTEPENSMSTEETATAGTSAPVDGPSGVSGVPAAREFKPRRIVILEALSATGLRSIRYAKEIPLVKYVLANDLSSSAVAAMQRNVEINGLAGETEDDQGSSTSGLKKPDVTQPKVRVNEGDACALMYNHRAPGDRVDVVDLDPYGTAAPFIDAAVQCVDDGGLLCVTCTDLMVLASTNYPEKCFSNYGGLPLKAEYCHEAALRLVLHAISTSASRYGRYVEPLLCLSIDFYVRLFVRVRTAPIEVKKVIGKTSMYYVCSGCQAWYPQPLARTKETQHAHGNVTVSCKAHTGPTVTNKCPECNSSLHVAGPMWSGPLHDRSFVSRVLKHVDETEGQYGTAVRMKGMLTVASEELESPFYFTPGNVSGRFHCVSPGLDDIASALLHAGHQISRSHAAPGSIKTSANYADIYEIFRSWVKLHPVKKERISENSPSFHLLAKEPKAEANFSHHPQSVAASSRVKLVRYQENPPNWGPGTKAKAGSSSKKRKNVEDDEAVV